jgi:CheY-like chemotaxis protein
VAEDNAVNQRVVRAMLLRLGLEVDVVGNGAEAVAAAALVEYRAIFMDCQMPVLDGFKATAAIRQHQGALRHTPIIAVTASAMKSDELRCLAAGMDDHIAKPLTLEAVATVLARWVPDTDDRASTTVRGAASASSPSPTGPPAAAAEPIGRARPTDPPATPSSPTDLPAVAPEPIGPARPSRFALPDGPPIDAEVVDRLARLGDAEGEDLLGQLATLFLADADVRMLALRQALAAADALGMSRSAHGLRGASANLGAVGLASLCATLEQRSDVGDLSDGEALLDTLQTELERVGPALRSWTPTA